MDRMKTAVALGFFSRQHLAGVMLLGPRLSGRIYSAVEQNALQVLCGQFAVAIDNAQLFTEVENARIYNQTLLENLTTGVIAAGADERVTVFNNEAGQIIGINPRDVIDDRLALADRFGLTLGFHAIDQETYLAIIDRYAEAYALPFDASDALLWATRRGARSGRVAWHYVSELAGRAGRPL